MSELKVKHPDFARRLNEVMDLRGRDIIDISESTGIDYEMVRRYTHGYAKPRDKNLRKIADELNTTLTYLSYGELPIEKPNLEQLKNNKGCNGFAEAERAQLINTDMLPVISWVAAGSFSLVDPVTLDDIIDSAPSVPRYPDMSPKAFGLIIKGRSMAPIFQPGDIIHVEPEITPWDLKDGDLVVVLCDDGKEATFKQLIIGDTSDDMYLKPLNPDWHEQKIIPMGECHLVGKVKHCTKNF